MSKDLLDIDDFFAVGADAADKSSEPAASPLNDDFFMINEVGSEPAGILSLDESIGPATLDTSMDADDFFSLSPPAKKDSAEGIHSMENSLDGMSLSNANDTDDFFGLPNAETLNPGPGKTLPVVASPSQQNQDIFGPSFVEVGEKNDGNAGETLFSSPNAQDLFADILTPGAKSGVVSSLPQSNIPSDDIFELKSQEPSPKGILKSSHTPDTFAPQTVPISLMPQATKVNIDLTKPIMNLADRQSTPHVHSDIPTSLPPAQGVGNFNITNVQIEQQPAAMLVVNQEAVAENAMGAVDQFLADLERQKYERENQTPAPSLNLDAVIKQSTTLMQAPTPGEDEESLHIPNSSTKKNKGMKKKVSWAESGKPSGSKGAHSSGDTVTDDIETEPTIKLPQISEKWDTAFSEIDDGREHLPTTDLEKVQRKVRLFVDNFSVRLFGCVLILLDIVLTIIDLSIQDKPKKTQLFYDAMALTISIIFMIDLLLRIFAYGPKRFFSNKWEVADACIIVITFVTVVVYIALDEKIEQADTSAADIGRLIVLTRSLRIIRFTRIIYGHQQVQSAARQTVSQNKRRYRKDGFDLDLTYVTDRVIAMSFPSSGGTSVFRNPIEEVSRFMKTKHPGSYKLYNLCSERSYDPMFFEGRVGRVLIDDHNVPRLSDLMKFIENAREWMKEDETHIMAIHCKGGKGRTGTIICSWLLEDGKFETARDALNYFGERRTDLEVGQTFQGVETASQIRYVEYFEKVKKEHGGRIPDLVTLNLRTVKICSIKGVGRGNGSDLSMTIKIDGNEVFHCKFAEGLNCKMLHNSEQNYVICELESCPSLTGDIKVIFTSTCKELPRGYDNCPFYYWFHTSFVPQDRKLRLGREEIDNPHKKKTWHIYQEDFAIEMEFENAESLA